MKSGKFYTINVFVFGLFVFPLRLYLYKLVTSFFLLSICLFSSSYIHFCPHIQQTKNKIDFLSDQFSCLSESIEEFHENGSSCINSRHQQTSVTKEKKKKGTSSFHFYYLNCWFSFSSAICHTLLSNSTYFLQKEGSSTPSIVESRPYFHSPQELRNLIPKVTISFRRGR